MKRCHLKNIKNRPHLDAQSGQAIVEYVLILVVSVVLILMVSSQLFRPMQTFLQDYMGHYVSCLLETGELPKLGNPNESPGGCQVKPMEKGQAVSGLNGASGTSGSEGSGSEGSGNNSNAVASESAAAAAARERAAASARNSAGLNANRLNSGQGSADGKSNSSKVTEIQINDSSGSGFFKGRSGIFASDLAAKKTRNLGINGLTEDEKKKLDKKNKGATKVISTNDGFAPKPKKTNVKPPERKVASDAQDEKGFEFSYLLRIFFILAIIIIIISLIGGQVAQLIKSWEN